MGGDEQYHDEAGAVWRSLRNESSTPRAGTYGTFDTPHPETGGLRPECLDLSFVIQHNRSDSHYPRKHKREDTLWLPDVSTSDHEFMGECEYELVRLRGLSMQGRSTPQ